MLNRKIPHQIVMVVRGRMFEFPVRRILVALFHRLRSPDHVRRSNVVTPRPTSLTVTWLSRSGQLRYLFFQPLWRLRPHRNLRREQLRPVLPVLRVLSLPPILLLDDWATVMLLLFISHMVSETPIVLLSLMKTLVSTTTQT
jgi:hypothetical protein